MSGAQPADREPFVLPADAPRWCNDLAISEAEARGFIEPKTIYSIGPSKLFKLGFWVAGVSCAGPGRPFVVRNPESTRAAILPRWSQAAAAMLDIARDYDEAVRDHGDVRIPGRKDSPRGRSIHAPRKPTEGVRLNPQRRREVITALRGCLMVPARSPLTPWEVELAGAILDVLHSRQRGLSAMELDHTERLMKKIAGNGR